MLSHAFTSDRIEPNFRGLLLAVVIAAAATFLSEHYGAPVMLFALLIGMAFQLSGRREQLRGGDRVSPPRPCCASGLAFWACVLASRMSAAWASAPVIAIIGFVLATFACGALMSLLLGRRMAFGMLAGGSVAICGASAALAIASVLPPHKNREQDTLFVVIGVTALSTIAMIAYPILFKSLGLSDAQSGFLVGATIHDVAQVVGAGYSISDEAGVIATYVKILRVALLPVVMLVVMLSFRGAQNPARRRSVVSGDVRPLRRDRQSWHPAGRPSGPLVRSVTLVSYHRNLGAWGENQPCPHRQGKA